MSNFNIKKYLAESKLFEEDETTEKELDALDAEIASAFGSGLSALQGQVAEAKKQVDESEDKLDEAVGSILISLILSAPKILEIIGGIVKKVATKFAKEKDKVTAGDALVHTGHYLEEKYLGVLKKIIKVTGIAKKANITTDEQLEVAAKVLLYSILGAAAVTAGFASAEALGAALAGKGVGAATYGVAKGSLAGLKSSEIVDGVKKIVAKA